ncbi:unnamed protein product [Miscanthus lutarioriparius]|uniref:Uncharacterized protein n=1 Tax=Miscanthus lutarioriparius TaxID=422564 RepID=A0A811QBC6_9POAL|nr:unnamed protein product [Miscanthus lutarioriparius]
MATQEEQLGQILALLDEKSKGINELKSSMSEMRALKTEIATWKPQVDNRVNELEHAVLDLGERVERALGVLLPPSELVVEASPGSVTIAQPSPSTGREEISASPGEKVLGSTHLEPTLKGAASGSLDHGKGSTHRGASFGAVYTVAPNPTPVTGAMKLPKTPPIAYNLDDSVPRDWLIYTPVHPPIPSIEFLTFDGSNPRLWIKNCETFFELYATDPRIWVQCASMRFISSAALWYQTVQATLSAMNWENFLFALFAIGLIKTSTTIYLDNSFTSNKCPQVSDYVEQFSDLVHQLLAHDPSFPQTAITNRFVDGLKKDIRAVVMMHRPQDLDIASSLAFLQEEAVHDQFSGRTEFGPYSKKHSFEVVKQSSVIAPSPIRIVDDKKVADALKPKTGDD